jgi:hypothetical protein
MRSEVASGIIGMGGADGGVAPPPVVTGGMVVGTWPAEAASGRLGGNEVGAPPELTEAGMPALVLVEPRELPPPAGGRKSVNNMTNAVLAAAKAWQRRCSRACHKPGPAGSALQQVWSR